MAKGKGWAVGSIILKNHRKPDQSPSLAQEKVGLCLPRNLLAIQVTINLPRPICMMALCLRGGVEGEKRDISETR